MSGRARRSQREQGHPEGLLRLHRHAAAPCVSRRCAGSPIVTPASRRAPYLGHCPDRGAPSGAGGAFPFARTDSPKSPSPPAASRRSFPGPGDRGTALPSSPVRRLLSLGATPALRDPAEPPLLPPSLWPPGGERRTQRPPGCPALTGFQSQLRTLPSRRLRLQTHPSKSDSNNSHVRPGRNDTPSPSRPPKRRTNPLILHENTRVTDHTV